LASQQPVVQEAALHRRTGGVQDDNSAAGNATARMTTRRVEITRTP
jgi:hypothetical protein